MSERKILVLLIGFCLFYACWAVGMSIYTENMPVVSKAPSKRR
ncbi:MAG: hypothetical protein ACLRXC_12210 [[Clostridium] leptum]